VAVLLQVPSILTKAFSSNSLLLRAAVMEDVQLKQECEISLSEETTVSLTFHKERHHQSTALCYATSAGNIVAMADLIMAKADVNFQDYMGQTPLHIAAASGADVKVAALLILHEANIHIVDKVSHTPLDLAISSRNRQVEQLLHTKGAKIQQARLNNDAIRGCWAIDRKDVTVGEELSCTLKSRVFRGKWGIIDVAVKYPLDHEKALELVEAEEDTLLFGQVQYQEMLHEIVILHSLRHPDLVLFLGACLHDQPIMLVTEYMVGGNLEQYYVTKRKACKGIYRPPIRRLLEWAKALCRALAFLHGSFRCIIHRDLKPLNLLLAQDLALKVADFGISKLSSSSCFSDFTTMTGGVGSLRYMAPEVARQQEYNEKADIYSAGLIFYFLSSGRAPYHEHGTNPEVVLEQFLEGQEPRPRSSECHQFLRHIMEAAWHQDPWSRPCASELHRMLLESDTEAPCCTVS